MGRLRMTPGGLQMWMEMMNGGGGDPYAGYDYYVSSVNANKSDDNDGTSSLAPFATLGKLATVLQAGQSVGLERGSTWREKITVGTAGDVWDDNGVYAYGVGNAPKIHCDDIIAAGSWSKTGGQTNVYQATITKDYSASEPCTYAAWVNDVQLIKATSLANCDSTPGSCFAVNYDANSAMTFYIHSTESSDPTSDGKTVEVAVRHSGVYGFYATNLTVDGIEFRRNFSFGGAVKAGQEHDIKNCTFRQGSSHSLYVMPVGNVTDCTFIDCYNGTAGCTMLNYNKNIANGEDETIARCTFQMDNANIYAAPINGHNNTSGYFGTITIADCTFDGFTTSGIMFGCNHASQIVMTNPTFIDSYGISGPATSAVNAGCNFTVTGGTWDSVVAGLRAVSYTGVMAPLVMTEFTMTLDVLPSPSLVFWGANATINISNCIFKSNLGAGSRVAIQGQTCPTANVTLNNNTFHTGSGSWTYHYGWLASASGMALASDNNTFELTTFGMYIFGATYASLATYQAAVAPIDANSTVV